MLTFHTLNDSKRLILCFAFVLTYTLFFMSGHISQWKFAKDTRRYWDPSFSDPWRSHRTPGLKMYIKAIGAYEATKKIMPLGENIEKRTIIALNDEEANTAFKRIANANYLLLSISIAILAVALACHISLPAAIFMPLIFLHLTKLPSPSLILADQLAAILTILFTAIGLFFIKNKNLVFLFSASLCAAYAFLVKPAMITLVVIAGILIFVSLIYSYNDKSRRIKIALIGIFFSICALIWPINLYMKGGLLVINQMSARTETMRAMYLLQPGDELLFSDPADKKLVTEFLRRKPNVDRKLDELYFQDGRDNYSKAFIYKHSTNAYRRFYKEVFRKIRSGVKLNMLEWNKVSKSVCKPIIAAHFDENVKVIGRSFLTAFGWYYDYNQSPFSNNILRKHFNHKISFAVYIGIFLVILSAMAVGHKPMRYVVIFVACLHPLACLLNSIGYTVLQRYAETTEWSLLLAFMLALWSLAVKISHKRTEPEKLISVGQGEAA